MVHNHSEHEQQAVIGRRALRINLIIVLVIMAVEIVGGMLSNSLSLLGDAGHMLVDALALGLSLFALTISQRPATSTKTFGFYRVEIIAALANGVTLVLVSIFVFYESYRRFLSPPQVHTPIMLAVAAVGLVANFIGIYMLRRAGQGLNIKAAWWHIVGDAISSLGVIGAGIVITFTGWYYADPLIAVIIGIIILVGAVRLVRESVNILLEAVPKQVVIEKVIQTLKELTGVEDVHDIHIWTITSGMFALSAHLVVKDRTVSQSAEIVTAANQALADHYNITHTTLQLECDTCPTNNVCSISPNEHQEAADG
jgi:cobalt-zinc-cadmium efflux system protein